MDEETIELAVILRNLNMGALYLALTDTLTAEGRFEPDKVRHLAFIFSDTAQLLHKYADTDEDPDVPPTLIEGDTATS